MVIANPYASQDLFIPREVHERVGDFVGRGSNDGKPFPRFIDAWWLAIGLGVQFGERRPTPDDRIKFNDGSILSSDPWRITQLELLAVAEAGADAVHSPPTVIRIASEYANGGFPWLLDQMTGQAEPALALMNKLGDFAS
jgi:hypothetical protein